MEISRENRSELIKKYGLVKIEQFENCLKDIDKFLNKKERNLQDIYNIGLSLGFITFFYMDLPIEIRNILSDLHNNLSLNIEKHLR